MAQSDSEKQAELIQRSEEYLADEIYIRTVPLLEEAAGYHGKYTQQAEELLKTVYQKLFDQSGYRTKYTDLLERQMSRKDPEPQVFAEAAEYYFDLSKDKEALAILRDGIEKTGDGELQALYEEKRYSFRLERATYQEVTTAANGAIQVKRNGYWGLAEANGELRIPCEYEKVSTYSGDRVIVCRDGVITAVDLQNNRLAKLHEEAADFGNYAEDRVPLLLADGWHRANGEFTIGASSFEAIGMYAGGYAAAQQDGKWGVIDLNNDWLVPPEYDEILQDELGRCYGQGAVFGRKGEEVFLLVDGEPVGESYQDACPFLDGYAAVKRNGLWGFIDPQGNIQIDFQFQDAKSFGQHLAAVRDGDFWGYISLTGDLVIQPEFLEAKNFSNGSAPVKTADGWRFITLLEYEKGSSL